MSRYTNTLLTKDDKKFLKETKMKLIQKGYKQASMSKIIRYSVEELKTKKFQSIIDGMTEKKIINGPVISYDLL